MDKDSEIESLKLSVKMLQLKLELAESNSRHWERMYHISDDAFHRSLGIQMCNKEKEETI